MNDLATVDPLGSDEPAEIAPRVDRTGDGADLCRALGHPARLAIVAALTAGERGVSELEAVTGIRQPGLSRELGKLRDAGLVVARRQSKAVFYSLIDDRAERVVAALWPGMACCATADPRSASKDRARGPAGRTGREAAAAGASVFARAGWSTDGSR
ncbi:hypothetical protein CCR85_07675 [Rhodothalassium salexigens]|uniref:DNA-binding transcriptional ArsR family regulator n=1 Tax=Rhodothalassium salexigens DSM 2132 TaxID=1188247 RepID=A0A4R2PH82_RHOSA|nr:metalloregulator ArsR/SmtB family transcription factor [Rhodothalassium salexigens]MBB4211905.1 DNA-binding transcriptional ArsR family regulator [Rhodothalassium salexigens DSM 2132]MBK1639820.1 hypothetical protein [Rhodothalassium salexigens DSM 2132]MBK5911371.1 hypothetical protein [Rhodothalassium salexigens]MBK5921869.1 hypothetical protein [Rhodothalassium salexigens]TCP33511.1 DNA-binding transcriptional ArsR family regulator [Rhodothalassium salexigens DSM 2132]